MPDELENFQTTGLSWQERAEQAEGVAAVYSPNNLFRSQWISLVNSVNLQSATRKTKDADTVLDFGCGIGHLTYLMSLPAGNTIGVDITPAMLKRAQHTYNNSSILFGQIDGIHLPLQSGSLNMVWVCGVLRYSLLVPQPRHREIVNEFFRVLKPGGRVYNLEMYVCQPSRIFSKDFLEGGFQLISAPVVHVHKSIFDRIAVGKYRRIFLQKWWARISVWQTQKMIREDQLHEEFRDYFFEYKKPK
jgi:ubiquinone/menaquinone biosynthesis C-methylase UbiE